MNQHLGLYNLVADGDSIYTGTLESVETQSLPAGKQLVAVRMRIDETLYGVPGAPIRRCEIVRSDSEAARAKFPDPKWGLVDLQLNARVLMATRRTNDETGDPDYVDEIKNDKDPVIVAVRDVLKAERTPADDAQRIARWTGWVESGHTVARLYGAEALAGDKLTADQADAAAAAMGAAISNDRDEYVQVSIATWDWQKIMPRCGPKGRAACVNSMLAGAAAPSADLRRLAVDRLTTLDPESLKDPAIVASPAAIDAIKKRAAAETDGIVRASIEKVAAALER